MNDILSPQLEMHFIELEKIQYSDIKKLKRSDRWIAYFSKKVSDADRKELAEMEPMIKEALEHEQIFMHNPALRREYEAREKAVRDEQSRIKTASDASFKKGIEEERVRQEQKQMKQILSLMKNMSIDLEKAMNTLEMTEEDKKVYRRLINS